MRRAQAVGRLSQGRARRVRRGGLGEGGRSDSVRMWGAIPCRVGRHPKPRASASPGRRRSGWTDVGVAVQPACKPGSVRRAGEPSRVTTIPLGRPSPAASSDQPGRQPGNGLDRGLAVPSPCPVAPIRSCSRWGLPCRRRCRRRGALLPHPFTLTRTRDRSRRRAVCFLWRCPWGRPRRTLSGTVFPWSPDFPPRSPRGGMRRPSGRLAPVPTAAAAGWKATMARLRSRARKSGTAPAGVPTAAALTRGRAGPRAPPAPKTRR